MKGGCPRDDVHRYNDSSTCCHPLESSCGNFTAGGNDIIGGVNARPMEFPWMVGELRFCEWCVDYEFVRNEQIMILYVMIRS